MAAHRECWLRGDRGGVHDLYSRRLYTIRQLRKGIGNRVNAAAALGFAVVLYSLAVLVALLVVRALNTDAVVANFLRDCRRGHDRGCSLLFVSEINTDRRSLRTRRCAAARSAGRREERHPTPRPGYDCLSFRRRRRDRAECIHLRAAERRHGSVAPAVERRHDRGRAGSEHGGGLAGKHQGELRN